MSWPTCDKCGNTWDAGLVMLTHCPKCGASIPDAPMRAERPANAMMASDEARWFQIQALARRVASKEGAPSELESALCGAVVRVREARTAANEIARAWMYAYTSLGCDESTARTIVDNEIEAYKRSILETTDPIDLLALFVPHMKHVHDAGPQHDRWQSPTLTESIAYAEELLRRRGR